jgi:hypothetical protein
MAGAKIACDYPATGLSTPLGAFGRFLEDIMHVAGDGGPEALAHLQRILGYGITGYTSNQIMLMMVGEGSAGKSLLLALIRKLLGPFYRDVSRDMIVNIKGQRPASKGAANPMEAGERTTPHSHCAHCFSSLRRYRPVVSALSDLVLFDLRRIRTPLMHDSLFPSLDPVPLRDEVVYSYRSERCAGRGMRRGEQLGHSVNEAALKKLVGTEVITSRELYKAFVTFETTQLVR